MGWPGHLEHWHVPTLAEIKSAFGRATAPLAAPTTEMPRMGLLRLLGGLFTGGAGSSIMVGVWLTCAAALGIVAAWGHTKWENHITYWTNEGIAQCQKTVNAATVRNLQAALEASAKQGREMALRLTWLEKDRTADQEALANVRADLLATQQVLKDAPKSQCVRPDAVIDALNRGVSK